MFFDMFHIQMQLILRLDWWNEYVCTEDLFFLLAGANGELYFNTPMKIVVFSACSQASFP